MHYHKDNPETIQSLFDTIAMRYDLANSLMSLHLYKLWNQALVRKVAAHIGQKKAVNVLDLCAGTGDIAFRMFRALHHNIDRIELLDFSKEMLSIAKERANKLPQEKRERLFFHQGDAQQLPFHDNSFDAITIAYGIRNVENPKRCLSECFRTLKPEGITAILELSRPKNKLLKSLYSSFLQYAIPIIGAAVTGNKNAYSYFKSSILSFMPQEELLSIAQDVGFTHCRATSLAGGIATCYILRK